MKYCQKPMNGVFIDIWTNKQQYVIFLPITVVFALNECVLKVGASATTSQRYWPSVLVVTLFNITRCRSDCETWSWKYNSLYIFVVIWKLPYKMYHKF